MDIAAFLLGSAAPIAAFMATKAAGGADLHPQQSGGPKRQRRMAKAADFASRWKGAQRRRKIVGRSHCRSAPPGARSPSFSLAAPQGRVIGISATGRRRVEFDLIDFYHNETRLIGADCRKLDTAASARLMAELVSGFETDPYKPPLIAGCYPLSAARDAYQAVAGGSAGRVVLTP